MGFRVQNKVVMPLYRHNNTNPFFLLFSELAFLLIQVLLLILCAVHTLALAWSRSFPIVKSNLHKHSKDSSSLLFSSLTTQSCMMLSVNICKQHNYYNKAQNNKQSMAMVIDNISKPGMVLFIQFTLCTYWVENRRKLI